MRQTGVSAWEPVEIPQEKCIVWRFPRHSIWVERVESEWHVCSLPEGGGGNEGCAFFVPRSKKPTTTQWRHYLHRDGGAVKPSPVLPDRPVVVRPDRPLTLLPGQSTIFFLQLPVWFRLSTSGPRPARIFEEPLRALTRTWFGDPVNGELCWGLATRLHHAIESVAASPDIAICPLMIENSSETDLAFEKICLHVENLSLFRGEMHMWTNSLHAVFTGPEQTTQIEIIRTPPGFEEGMALVTEARQPAEGWSIRRTFGMLKTFTEF
jgi:hypothetical protein